MRTTSQSSNNFRPIKKRTIAKGERQEKRCSSRAKLRPFEITPSDATVITLKTRRNEMCVFVLLLVTSVCVGVEKASAAAKERAAIGRKARQYNAAIRRGDWWPVLQQTAHCPLSALRHYANFVHVHQSELSVLKRVVQLLFYQNKILFRKPCPSR